MLTSLTMGALAIALLGNALQGPNVQVLLSGQENVEYATLSPTGDRIIYGDASRGLLQEVFRNGQRRSLSSQNGRYASPRFSPDGMFLLLDVADERGRVQSVEVRRISDGKRVLELPANHANWAPDSSQLAVATRGLGVTVINFPVGTAQHFFPALKNVESLTFSPNAAMLAIVEVSRNRRNARLRCLDIKSEWCF